MAFGFVSVTVQMSYATTRGRGILKIERFQILIDLNNVMLVPRLGTEYAGTGYPAPPWPIVLPHCLLTRSDYWHVASSSAVVLNFYIALLALCNLQFRCPA